MATITRTEIDIIIACLIDVSQAYLNYEREKKAILQDYRGNALEERLKTLNADLKFRVTPKVAGIQRSLENLIEKTKKGNDYDLANSGMVSHAAQLLSAPGVSMESAEKVVEKFKGNQVALELLNASADVSYTPIIDKWMFDNVGILEKARSIASQLNYEDASHYPGIVSAIREAIQSYAWHQGIDIGSIGETLERLRIINIAAMMGLDPDEL